MGKGKYRITKFAKVLIIQLMICSIGVTCGFSWEIYNESTKWDNLYYPGVKIANLDLSGKTKDEGKGLLKSEYTDKLNDYKLNIRVLDKIFVLDYSRLIKSNNIDKVADEAFGTGKDLDLYSKHFLIKKGVSNNYELSFALDKDYLDDFISSIEKEINNEPINAKIELDSDGLISIIDGVSGQKLQREQLEKYINDSIKEKSLESDTVEISVEKIPASITADMLSPIDAIIASSKTSYASSSIERVNNVELASRTINGKLLMPGDVFSLNEILGERTLEKGYKIAPVIEEGDFKSGIGGGICQVSSTLYNAVLRSGLSIVERESHSLPVSYIGLGLDATVSWGSIDFKFENTSDYPIFIESYTKNKVLYVNLYSNSNLAKGKHVIRNEVYDKISAKTEIIEDKNLPLGKGIVINKGSDGYWVKVVRSTYENGELVDSEIISDDYYEPVDRVIKKGTGIKEEG